MCNDEVFEARNLISGLCRVRPTNPSRHTLSAARISSELATLLTYAPLTPFHERLLVCQNPRGQEDGSLLIRTASPVRTRAVSAGAGRQQLGGTDARIRIKPGLAPTQTKTRS